MTEFVESSAPIPALDDNRTFPELLRHHRIRAGLTQRALADLSTVSPRAIRDLEAGRANARTQTIHLLADGLRLQGGVREHFIQTSLNRRPTGPFDDDLGPETPQPGNVLHGREPEVHKMVEVLESGRDRMISLSGLPGVGKTRVVAEVAARLGAGRRWPVLWIGPDPAGPGTASGALMRSLRSLMESRLESITQVRQLVGRHEALLVLDGIAEATVPMSVAELLASCPGLRVISASRRPWHVPGGRAVVVSPLATPGLGRPTADLVATPSMRLLVDRLTEARPGFVLSPAEAGAAAEMCRRLDGLPLALEVVALRARVLSLRQLLDVPVADLLDVALPGRPQRTTLGELIGATLARLTAGQTAILVELARAERVWTVSRLVGVLRRPLDEVVDGLAMLIGHGLVRAAHGEQRADLDVPNLVRAFLLRQPRPQGVGVA